MDCPSIILIAPSAPYVTLETPNIPAFSFAIPASTLSLLVTGSNPLPVANFTGLGGTIVYTDGYNVFISGITGGGGGGGGGITIGQLNSLSGFTTGISGYLQSQISAGGVTIGQLNSLSGFTTGLSGYDAYTYATIINLFLTGQALYGLYTGLSGLFFNNLQSTGQTLYNYIIGWSGIQQDFSTLVPTGSGSLTIYFPNSFSTIPLSVECSMIIYTGNNVGYALWPTQLSATQYICVFSDTVLETGNYVSTRSHL